MNYYNEVEEDLENQYIQEEPNEEDYTSGKNTRIMDPPDNSPAFAQLEDTAHRFIENGQLDQGFQRLEQCIDHLLSLLQEGTEAPLFQDFIERNIVYLNDVALRLMKEDKIKDAMKVLEKCQQWTHPEKFGVYPGLRNLTFNHLGCCYRRLGKLDKALFYLERALQFINGLNKVETSGITHVNLCAVLSQMGDHYRALDHAKLAVSDCAYDFVQLTNKTTGGDDEEILKKARMLAIAYHNLGSEEDYCKNLEGAVQSYFKAFRLYEENFGPDDPIIEKFKNSYEEARQRLFNHQFKNSQKVFTTQGMRLPRADSGPKIIIKRPPSSGANKGNNPAKVYLHHNKVFVPKPEGSPTRQIQGGIAFPASIQKYQPNKAGMPTVGGKMRPNTAHPSTRNQHYHVDGGINQHSPDRGPRRESDPPNDNKEKYYQVAQRFNAEAGTQSRPLKPSSAHKKGQSKTPVHEIRDEDYEVVHRETPQADVGYQLQKLGLENEDEQIQSVFYHDMKNNRVGFLNNLSQYDKGRKTGGENILEADTFSVPSSNQFTGKKNNVKDESPQARGSNKPSGKEVIKPKPKEDPKVLKLKIGAAILIQKYIRRFLIKRRLRNRLGKSTFMTILVEIVKQNLEGQAYVKDPRYYVLMLFQPGSDTLHIDVKNIHTKKFFRGFLEYQPASTQNRQLIQELKLACKKLLGTISLQGRNVIFNDINEIEEEDEQKLTNKNNKIKKSSQDEFEEDIEVDEEIEEEPPKKQLQKSKVEEQPTKDPKQGHHQAKQVGDLEFEDLDEEEPQPKKAQNSKGKNDTVPTKNSKVKSSEQYGEDFDEYESEPQEDGQSKVKPPNLVEEKKKKLNSFGFEDHEMDKIKRIAIKIQKIIRGKLARIRYKQKLEKEFRKPLLNKHYKHEGHNIGVFILEKRAEKMKVGDCPVYMVHYYDYTKNVPFNKIEIPKDSIKVGNVTAQYMETILDIDYKNHYLTLKKETPNRTESSLSEFKKSDNIELLTELPISFADGHIDAKIYHNNAKNEIILVPDKNEDFNSKKALRIGVESMGLKTFNKDFFLDNIDNLLLVRLSYNRGKVTFDVTPIDDRSREEKRDPKDSLNKSKSTQNKRYSEPVDDIEEEFDDILGKGSTDFNALNTQSQEPIKPRYDFTKKEEPAVHHSAVPHEFDNDVFSSNDHLNQPNKPADKKKTDPKKSDPFELEEQLDGDFEQPFDDEPKMPLIKENDDVLVLPSKNEDHDHSSNSNKHHEEVHHHHIHDKVGHIDAGLIAEEETPALHKDNRRLESSFDKKPKPQTPEKKNTQASSDQERAVNNTAEHKKSRVEQAHENDEAFDELEGEEPEANELEFDGDVLGEELVNEVPRTNPKEETKHDETRHDRTEDRDTSRKHNRFDYDFDSTPRSENSQRKLDTDHGSDHIGQSAHPYEKVLMDPIEEDPHEHQQVVSKKPNKSDDVAEEQDKSSFEEPPRTETFGTIEHGDASGHEKPRARHPTPKPNQKSFDTKQPNKSFESKKLDKSVDDYHPETKPENKSQEIKQEGTNITEPFEDETEPPQEEIQTVKDNMHHPHTEKEPNNDAHPITEDLHHEKDENSNDNHDNSQKEKHHHPDSINEKKDPEIHDPKQTDSPKEHHKAADYLKVNPELTSSVKPVVSSVEASSTKFEVQDMKHAPSKGMRSSSLENDSMGYEDDLEYGEEDNKSAEIIKKEGVENSDEDYEY